MHLHVAGTLSNQQTTSAAAFGAVLRVSPLLLRAFSAVSLQVSFGGLVFPFPRGVLCGAVLGGESGGIGQTFKPLPVPCLDCHFKIRG